MVAVSFPQKCVLVDVSAGVSFWLQWQGIPANRKPYNIPKMRTVGQTISILKWEQRSWTPM